VLAGAVDAGKGLLVQQTFEPVTPRLLLENLHGQLVVVDREICLFKNRRELVLAGRDLVVFGLCADAELPEFHVHIAHKRGDALPEYAEVVVVELLALCGHTAEERAAGVNQILPLQILFAVNEEILLLGADRGLDPFRVVYAEEL